VHQAVMTWTNQSETKASFLLPLESALFVFLGQRLLGGTLTEEQQIQNSGWLSGIYIIGGLAFLLTGLAFLMMVVIPRLRERSLAAERQDHAIYFGHLKGLDEARIKQLLTGPTVIDQLARQLKVASDIAWTKHLYLKLSMIAGTIGSLVIVGCYFYAALR
jgi:hypothetical protein